MPPTLLCILEHPTQYDPPLWTAMARRQRLIPQVWYSQVSDPLDVELKRTVGWGARGGYLEQQLSGWERLQALLQLQPKPSAILCSGWKNQSTWQVLAAARARGIPVLVPSDRTLNEPDASFPWRTPKNLARAVLGRRFDGFVTTGTLGTQALMSVGVPQERIAAALYPVDVQAWQAQAKRRAPEAAQLRRSLGASAGAPFVVLAVAKLAEREDPLTLLDGFARFSRQHPDARLILVGDGPLRADVEARVAQLGLGASVQLPGYVPYADLPLYYGAAQVFVHVPRFEPWGISVSEAMACGLPVIAATSVSSAADLVIEGRTGHLVNPGDADDLSRALQQLSRMEPSQMRSAVLERVQRADVQSASHALESLVARLRDVDRFAAFDPLHRVVRGSTRNVWGSWHP